MNFAHTTYTMHVLSSIRALDNQKTHQLLQNCRQYITWHIRVVQLWQDTTMHTHTWDVNGGCYKNLSSFFRRVISFTLLRNPLDKSSKRAKQMLLCKWSVKYKYIFNFVMYSWCVPHVVVLVGCCCLYFWKERNFMCWADTEIQMHLWLLLILLKLYVRWILCDICEIF